MSPLGRTWYDASPSWPPPQEILSPASRIGPIGGHQHRRRYLPPRDAPDYVNRPRRSITLKDKNTGSFGVGRVVLNPIAASIPSMTSPARIPSSAISS